MKISIILLLASSCEDKIIYKMEDPIHLGWKNYRYDYSNTGYYPGDGPTQGILVDTINIGYSSELSSPIIDDDGNIYITNADGLAYKIDSSLTIVWTKDLNVSIDISCATIIDSIVIWPTNDGELVGLSTLDGTLMWSLDLDDDIWNPPIIHDELKFGIVTTRNG